MRSLVVSSRDSPDFAGFGTSRPGSGASMREVTVVAAAIMRGRVALQFPADSGWGATQGMRDRADGVPAASQRGDAMPLQQTQVAAGPLVLEQADRRQPADESARLESAEAIGQQPPVLILQGQSSLASPSSHMQHSFPYRVLHRPLESARHKVVSFQSSLT